MRWGLLRAIIVLPGSVLVLIPATILWTTDSTQYAGKLVDPSHVVFWFALPLGAIGLSLGVWTVSLFKQFGEGTPAPWEPPKKLVIRGPYQYVRNPMITSVVIVLVAESILFGSWPMFAWMLFFLAGNIIYFPLVEEKGLEKRFGGDYRLYKANVPRWIPRLRAWPGLQRDGQSDRT